MELFAVFIIGETTSVSQASGGAECGLLLEYVMQFIAPHMQRCYTALGKLGRVLYRMVDEVFPIREERTKDGFLIEAQ